MPDFMNFDFLFTESRKGKKNYLFKKISLLKTVKYKRHRVIFHIARKSLTIYTYAV